MPYQFNVFSGKLDIVNPATSPAGSNNQLQFNNNGVFGGTDITSVDGSLNISGFDHSISTNHSNHWAVQQTFKTSNPIATDSGINLLTNSNPFVAGLTGWTSTGWYYASNAAQHTAGNTNALSQSFIASGNTMYKLSLSVSSGTTGFYSVNIYDGINTTTLGSNLGSGTKTFYYYSLNAATITLNFVPTSTFNRRIGVVVFQAIVRATPAITIRGTSSDTVEMSGGSEGTANIFFGLNAGQFVTSSIGNVAIGAGALSAATIQYGNTAVGAGALAVAWTPYGSTAGGYNTAIGYEALMNCTWGNYNVSIGYNSSASLSTGYNNTVVGNYAAGVTTGANNLVLGSVAAQALTTGSQNVAIGNSSAYSLIDGSYNFILGSDTGGHIYHGSYNIVIGYNADVPSDTDNQLSIANAIYGDLLYPKLGVGVFPTLELDIVGSVRNTKAQFTTGINIQTGTYTLLATDYIVVGNSGSALTFNLPAATGSGQNYLIKNINSGTLTVDANGSETIDGDLTKALAQWDSARLIDYATGAWIKI